VSDNDSFQSLLDGLQSGQQDASTELFERYADRLIRLARGRLNPRMLQKFDAEDVMQSVFRSFFCRNAEERFDIRDWGGMWAILVVMTIRKCNRRVAHLKSAKRDVTREEARHSDHDSSAADWQPISREPTPHEAAELTELVQQLMAGLTEQERTILVMKRQGCTVSEISRETGRSERTIHRNLTKLRERAEDLDLS
jgi:RNA polymerase sigma-70 factor (ECF subfamily)